MPIELHEKKKGIKAALRSAAFLAKVRAKRKAKEYSPVVKAAARKAAARAWELGVAYAKKELYGSRRRRKGRRKSRKHKRRHRR